MKALSKTLTALAVSLATLSSGAAFAQRTRSVSDTSASSTTPPPQTTPQTTTAAGQQSKQSVTTPRPAPAPSIVKAKYEGGVVGYGKSDGTLQFDDANKRLLFRDKKNNEMFSVPYSVVFAAWADTRSRRSTTGTVIASTVPYGLGLPGLLMKSKTRYLTLQYRDPDTKAEGLATFKLESKELLASVLYTFAEKAGLTQRGDAFVRRRDTATPEASSRAQDQN